MSKMSINVLPMHVIFPFCHGIILVKMIEMCFTSGLPSICMIICNMQQKNIKDIDMNIIMFEIIFTVHKHSWSVVIFTNLVPNSAHVCFTAKLLVRDWI